MYNLIKWGIAQAVIELEEKPLNKLKKTIEKLDEAEENLRNLTEKKCY